MTDKPKRPRGRPPGSGSGNAMTVAERVAKHVAKHSLVERRECANKSRRTRMEKDPAKWLRYYLAESFDIAFDKPHREIIAGAMRAHETGGRFAVAAERGIGKSTLLSGLVLFLALSGKRRFPVYLPWKAKDMRTGLQFWRTALAFNERLDADYPEYTAPFVHARGMTQRMPALRWHDNEEPCGAVLQITDGMIVFPDNLGVIGGSTINGSPRGLRKPQSDGSTLRPDLALIDDPQDRKTAKSSTLVLDVRTRIDGDVAGLGKAGAPFPLLLSGNCIEADDVMAHYLAEPTWRGLRVSCVERWPDGWEDNGPAYKLWQEWWSEYQDAPRKGAAFYRKKKAAMSKGMKITAPNAYNAHKSAMLPDKFCVAMLQYWQLGDVAHAAEKQQRPKSPDDLAPFALTVSLICSRADDRKAHEIPDYVKQVYASSDINEYGLSTVINGYGNDQTCAVLWYGMLERGPGRGIIDSNIPQAEKEKQLFDALCLAGEQIGGSASQPTVWAIDAGYMGQTVRRYADTVGRKCGMQIILCRGMDGQRYRPGYKAIGKPREQCHLTDWPQIGRGLVWNTHYWREVMQRAWLGDIGKPGSCSLPQGVHTDFAEQIWRERMLGRSEVGGKQVWVFAQQPGRHDFGDAHAQAYAVAAYSGIGTGGQVTAPRRKRYTQKDLQRR